MLLSVLLIAAQLTEVSNYDAVQRAMNASRAPLRVVNLWATWCGPCVAEMSDLKKLSAQHPDVSFLGVSLDDAIPGDRTEMKKKVTDFLRDRGIRYPNIYFTGRTTELTDRLKFEGALPATFVFGPDGKELTRVVGRLNYDSFSKKLVELEKQRKR